MAASHTPGPWAVHGMFPEYVVPSDHASRPVGGSVSDEHDLAYFAQEVCSTRGTGRHRLKGEVEANARLIAAAPSLLDEVKFLLKWEGCLTDEDYERIEALLAQVEGRT